MELKKKLLELFEIWCSVMWCIVGLLVVKICEQYVTALKVYHWVSRVSLPLLSEVEIGAKKSFTHLIYFLPPSHL